ncbi:MAG: VOC family protein [Anaerolineae bacterium]|jgi:catechol 2,3-dioxygenase-like lactoylglutathione lyase family enzyme
MAILKSHHIAIYTPDLKRLVAFYTDVLGFPTAGTLGDSITFVDIGGTRLEIIEKPEVTEPQEQGRMGMQHIAFEVDDVQKTYEEFKAKGVEFHIPAREARPGLHVAFFRDPDGNILEFFRATPEAMGLA